MLSSSHRSLRLLLCVFLVTALPALPSDSNLMAADSHDAPQEADAESPDASEEPTESSVEADEPAAPAATRPSLGQLKERLADRAMRSDEATEEPEQDQAQAQDEKPSPKEARDEKKETPKAEPAKKTLTVADLTLRGGFPEGPAQQGLFGEMHSSLDSMIGRLDAAAEDDAVSAVVLRIERLALGRGKLHELRCAVARIREAGKPVWAVLTSAEPAEYLLAAACDRIVMPESGMLVLPGVRAEMTFYKGLLDKLGIQFQTVQMGKYKGAAEPYSRAEMSGPLRESIGALVDDLYETLVQTIAAERNLEDYRVKTLLDVGVFTAKAARQAGLIDELVYADQIEERLRRELKADRVRLLSDYRRKQIDTNFTGMTGMMRLFELMLGGRPDATATAAKKIAVVYAVGPIMEGKNTTDLFGGQSVGSATMVEALRKAANDAKVAAIVLRIDSPGGSAIASDLIWRETVRIEKPVIASMGDVAGSGGYYIAMGADEIFAEPETITGSIGVVGGKLVLGGLYDKLGLTTEVVARGKNTGLFSATEPFTAEQHKVVSKTLREVYRQFVAKAAKGRNMDLAKLDALAQGRVYTGRMAAEVGLVDRLGTLADAVAAAKRAAGIEDSEKVEILMLPRPRTLFEQLFSDPAAMTELRALAPAIAPDLAGPLLARIDMLRRLFVEPALVWMPYEIQIR